MPRRPRWAAVALATALAAVLLPTAMAVAAPAPGKPRWRPPGLNDRPARGPAGAAHVIVMFVDLACPRTAAALPRLAGWAERRKDVQLLIRQRPLDFHPESSLLARLALAAHQQGLFWPFVNELLAHRDALELAQVKEHARRAGLDVPRLLKDADAGSVIIALADDLGEARRLAAADAPTLVVHGRPQPGDLPELVLDVLVDAGPPPAREAPGLAEGSGNEAPRPELERLAPPLDGSARPRLRLRREGAGPALPPGPGLLSAGTAVRVRVPAPSSAPSLGPALAPVTLVLYSDFQCRECSSGSRTVQDLQRIYGKNLRVVWQNLPLPFHPEAAEAALAALAAHRQHRFWAYHDRLFASQAQLDASLYETLARETGLDVARFNADRAARGVRDQVEAEARRAVQTGILGTPTLFINGRLVRGAQPLPVLRALVDEELARARAFLRKGTRPSALYEAVTADGERRIPGAPVLERF
jgi:protein-disulfide isomerase